MPASGQLALALIDRPGAGKKQSLLIVEDDRFLAKLLRQEFERSGYDVITAADGSSALAALGRRPDLVILDLGLPDMPGLKLLAALRCGNASLPVIVLSCFSDPAIKVSALDGGANDYVTKPFSFAEIQARVRARLRAQPEMARSRSVHLGDMQFDAERRKLVVRGVEVQLSQKECLLLSVLIAHQGMAMSYDTLMDRVWGAKGDQQLLRVFIGSLRKKIELDPREPRYIRTERGYGYSFHPAT